jgi:DNA-directed RNA polymerase I, II, and III subunit RPABC2
MFEDNDDFENEIENDISDEEDVPDIALVDEDQTTEDNGLKIITYNNVLENISQTIKKTIPFLTKFERARIVGVRLQQLANGAKPRIDTSNLRSIKEIVEKELLLRKIPFIIRRPLPNGKFEDWKLEEFESV